MAQFTEKAIIDTFTRLLEQMPLDKITVRDIITECGISRNTFYYHYGDIYALLEASLRRDIRQLKEKRCEGDGWYENLRQIFFYISENRKRVYHIYNSVNHDMLAQYIFQATEELFMGYVREAAGDLKVSEDDLHFLCFSYQSMLEGMLLNWLRRGMQGDPVEYLDRAHRLLLGNTRRILEASLQTKEPL
nr:TetR/AcrR family transcriptional regulator [uncultured Oscillibacter sp.]